MSWVVAIPSYKRAETLQRKTLRMLQKENIPAERITVFVASEAEALEYRKHYSDNFQPAIVVGKLGIHKQREFIQEYYPAGKHVLCIDDDVSAVKSIYGATPLVELVDKMFQIAVREKVRLWGVYPTDDGRCLQDRAVKGLVYCIGSFFGMINWRGSTYPYQTTEDFSRTLQAYTTDGAILRFEGLGPTTRYFKEPGGLQEFRTTELQEHEMKKLVEEYPMLVVPRYKNKKYADVRLKRKVLKMIEKPFINDSAHQ